MGGIVRQKGCKTKPNKVLLRNQIDGRRLMASLILLFFYRVPLSARVKQNSGE